MATIVVPVVSTTTIKTFEAAIRLVPEVIALGPLPEELFVSTLAIASSASLSPALLLFGLGVLDPHHLAVQSLAIEGSNGGIGLALRAHFHEAEDATVLQRLQ